MRLFPRAPPRILIHRHPLVVRVCHWINALALMVLFMSGLQIFNAHPALYWGKASSFAAPWMSIGARSEAGTLVGVTQLGAHALDTTGLLGASREDGRWQEQAFPAWITLPSVRWLALGRAWHFFFAWIFVANGLAFAAYAVSGRHLWRDLRPTWRELRGLPGSLGEHLRLRFPRGEAARHYNVLQKLAYLGVLLGLGPLAVLTGLTMSPTMDSAWPWLLSVFGGRQSARSLHFLCAFSFLAFLLVHLAMVVLSGPWNNLRSMLSGRYAIDVEPPTRHE